MRNLKKLRIENKLTQKELATILKVKYNSLSEWENGNAAPHIDIIEIIADYFNVSVDYLLGREDNSGITYPQRFIEVSDTEKQLIAEFRKSKHNAQKFLFDLEEKEEKE